MASFQLSYYKFNKINFKRGGSYINSLDCKIKKKATINPENEDDKFFQYGASVALNHEEIKKCPLIIRKKKTYKNKYNLNRINHSPKIDQWKTFEKNNLVSS